MEINNSIILKGIEEDAIYKEQELKEYENNPYIEALPKIFNDEDVIDMFYVLPRITEGDRNKDNNIRFHIIKRAKGFIQPLPIHITLERRLSTLIRRGYLSRNPLSKDFFSKIRVLNSITDINDYSKELKEQLENTRSTADILTIIGISGIGKTTAIERLLLMYPQVIRHTKYKDTNLTRTQIVWLKIDCPYDGNISTMCKSFFKAIDDILGTRYLDKYGYSSRVSSMMLINMSRLACQYGIGVLVIDEIQHLLNNKIDMEEMLNFFVTLTNTVGMPTVLIGTSKAQQIFKGNFRQARRAGSEGTIIWDRMDKNSEEWDFFLKSLWEFQGLKEVTELTDNIKEAFYDACQGITAIAVNLFLLAQERALQKGTEKLTIGILRETSKKDLYMIQPMIKALKNNNISEIIKYEDISIDIEEISRNNQRDIQFSGSIKEKLKERQKDNKLIRKSISESLIAELIESDLFNNLDINDIRGICENIVDNTEVNENYSIQKRQAFKKAMLLNDKKVKIKKQDSTFKENDGLIKIFNLAKEQKLHTYDLLNKKGYIKNPVEEFLG